MKITEYNIHLTPGFTICSPFLELECHFVFTMVDLSDCLFIIKK